MPSKPINCRGIYCFLLLSIQTNCVWILKRTRKFLYLWSKSPFKFTYLYRSHRLNSCLPPFSFSVRLLEKRKIFLFGLFFFRIYHWTLFLYSALDAIAEVPISSLTSVFMLKFYYWVFNFLDFCTLNFSLFFWV